MASEINDKLIPVDLEQEMKKSFISYAMAVIISRALPDVRDGLKPVHRRILYAMNELGMTPDKPYRKSARLVGDVLGKYHPHGDSSVYDAMVRLAQDFNIRYLLVDGQGNFGSVDGDGAAAMRYTEARMQKLTMHLLGEIDKDTVDFYPNFDETLLQPSVLPSRYPNLLVNGSNGIAVGMATNIPPHNLRESIDACIHMIDHPDCTVDDLMQFIKGPDFPTGGTILGMSGVRAAYHTGRGRIIVRAKTEIEAMAGNRSRIVVREIPYMVNKAKLVERIAELVHEKRLEGISAIRDESDRKGMRIVIELKKDVHPQIILNYLYKHTSMQETFGANMLALVDNEPKVLNLREMIYHYLRHQKEVVTRRTQYDLDKALARAHILEGLLKALDHIDEIVEIIKKSPDTPTARANLIERFQFSEKQAQAILDMRLARLTGLERERLEAEYDELQKSITYFNSLLADETLLMGVVKTEMAEIRDRFADERRTELTHLEGEIDIEDLIQSDDMVVTMTHFGYVKRLPKSTYRAQHRGGKGISAMTTREEDFVERLIIVNTHEDILFFTSKGRVYTLKCYQIPEAGRTARGMAIVNLLQVASDEKITAMIPVPRDAQDHYLVMMTKRGMIKRTPFSEFQNLRKAGLIAITLKEDDELVAVNLTDGDMSMIVGSKQGRALRFHESTIRIIGRNGMGVHAMRLRDDDEIIDMSMLLEGQQVLAITENGYGKRTDPEQYREQGRNGMGIKAMNLTDKTGLLAKHLAVNLDEDILLITDDGTIIRMAVSDIRETSRATQGVRLMRIAEGAKIVAVARAEQEQEEAPEEILDSDLFPADETITEELSLGDELSAGDSLPMDDSDI
ncbi:MAG: DNA gyrase subunit A [Clostridiales bacterium]|nr:DNA gyrase subunit A [Clostridiales bacterium]